MPESTIEWTDYTFNPWLGCEHATYTDRNGIEKPHPGCAHCYAENQADTRLGKVLWGPEGTRKITTDGYWKGPLAWNESGEGENSTAIDTRKVFCGSFCDIFEDWPGPIIDCKGNGLYHCFFENHLHSGPIPKVHGAIGPYCSRCERHTISLTMNDVRRRLGKLIRETRSLLWLLLTKRPQNAPKMMREMGIANLVNVAVGCSISDQETADSLLPLLLKCREVAPLLFVSAEPLLASIDLTRISIATSGKGSDFPRGLPHVQKTNVLRTTKHRPPIDWIIAGGESGPSARPCSVTWLKSLADQCAFHRTPFFCKQLGANITGLKTDGLEHDKVASILGSTYRLLNRKGADPSEWPPDLRIRQFPNYSIPSDQQPRVKEQTP